MALLLRVYADVNRLSARHDPRARLESELSRCVGEFEAGHVMLAWRAQGLVQGLVQLGVHGVMPKHETVVASRAQEFEAGHVMLAW